MDAMVRELNIEELAFVSGAGEIEEITVTAEAPSNSGHGSGGFVSSGGNGSGSAGGGAGGGPVDGRSPVEVQREQDEANRIARATEQSMRNHFRQQRENVADLLNDAAAVLGLTGVGAPFGGALAVGAIAIKRTHP